MNFTHKKLQYIDKKSENVVFGYIRQIQKLIPKNNGYYNIPMAVINIISLYFYDPLEIDEQSSSNKLKFIYNDTNKSVIIKQIESGWSTFIFNHEISSKMCNKFDLHIKWTTNKDCFFVGYITKSDIKNVKNWISFLGGTSNKCNGSCRGLYVAYYETMFSLYNGTGNHQYCKYKETNDNTIDGALATFQEINDFILSVDFKKNEWKMSHKYNEMIPISLDGCKSLIPAFNMYKKDAQIQIFNIVFMD